MNDTVYNASIANGNLHIKNREKFLIECESLKDGDYEIVLRKKKRIRSLALNKYYWAEVVPKIQAGLKECGTRLNLKQTDEWLADFFDTVSKEQAHDFVKDRFIEKITVDENTGEITQKKLTTTNMNNSEFKDYISQIVQFAAEHLNTQILMPNEQAKIDY